MANVLQRTRVYEMRILRIYRVTTNLARANAGGGMSLSSHHGDRIGFVQKFYAI